MRKNNEVSHARYPHLNPLPLAGEEANELLRKIEVKGCSHA